MTKRPNDLVGLSIFLLKLYIRRPLVWVVLGLALIGLVVLWVVSSSAPPVRIATFNIETYPQTPGQSAGAVQLLGTLDVDVVGVQEITDRDVFVENVRLYLGDEWETVFPDQKVFHSVGLVYDSTVLGVREVRTHYETVIHRGARATLEVRLETRGARNQRQVRVFVLHLKATSLGHEIRRRQLEALRPIVERAVDTGDEVVVLGDFNTTGDSDRVLVEEFGEATGLSWSSAEIPCTSYWDKKDICLTTALDHILANKDAREIRVRGACETVGCENRESCPVYIRMVSDHCPLTAVY